MPFQIPNDILFLARCVAILSGMCTGLDPNFNVWQALAPYAQKMIADEMTHGMGFWLEEFGAYAKLVLTLPQRLDSTLHKIERGDLSVKTPDIYRELSRLRRSNQQISIAIVFAALSLAGVQLYLADESLFASIFVFGAVITFVRFLLPRGH